MKKRRARKRCLLLLVYVTLLLLLLSMLLQDDWWTLSNNRSAEEHKGRLEHYPPRLCPSFNASMWENEQDNEEADSDDAVSPPPRTHVYLHATWRSGSSFLGELFNQHPQVFYLYEPAWHMWQSLYPGDAESLQGALRDMLSSLFRCDFSVLRLYGGNNLTTAGLFGGRSSKSICSVPFCSAGGPREKMGLVEPAECEKNCPARTLKDLEGECQRHPVVVIKDVRLMELSVLRPLLRDPGLNLKIVQLFRDPRAVHNSRLRSKRSLLRESLQVLRSRLRIVDPAIKAQQQLQLHRGGADYLLTGALEVICQAWIKDLLLLRRSGPSWLNKRYLRLRYEDLVLRPRDELGRLLRFIGLPAITELEQFVMNMTRGPSYSSDRPFLVSARNAREAVSAWKERLNREQVRKVEEACGEAMSALSYKPQEDEQRI
ncbi:carbohydrate sulfotransferase 7 [Pelobates fuscus]|uniref:carbohydrate sulfotransferase 7 n=1 Tax=Pelobates fuscus TaxID=191477 RepID=UPI002FE4B9F1